MVDVEKLAQEFAFLREKLRDIATLVVKNENTEAAFLLGALHTICHNHSVSLEQLISKNLSPAAEEKNDEVV